MKAFCDFHHGGMYHAMQMLFEGRLGYEIYRPVGLDWVKYGYWWVSDLEPTQRAYLYPGGEHWLGDDGYWRWRDNGEELLHKCMTFEQFCADPDIALVIQTHPGHEFPYQELQRKHKPSAKLIRVCGNTGEVIHNPPADNVMDSTLLQAGQARNYVTFHQEFDLTPFVEAPPPERLVIRQYLNFFQNNTTYFRHWQEYKPRLPEFEWRMHGHQGTDGFLYPVSKIAESMLDASFVWHVKVEGYGHAIHNAFAAGRPVITRIQDYAGRMAAAMLEDGVTCVDIGHGSVAENVAKIRHYAQPAELARLCANVRERFKRVVDFDAEEPEIRAFMGRLI